MCCLVLSSVPAIVEGNLGKCGLNTKKKIDRMWVCSRKYRDEILIFKLGVKKLTWGFSGHCSASSTHSLNTCAYSSIRNDIFPQLSWQVNLTWCSVFVGFSFIYFLLSLLKICWCRHVRLIIKWQHWRLHSEFKLLIFCHNKYG